MVYLAVLVGSALAIAAIVVGRLALRRRRLRNFVAHVQSSAEGKGPTEGVECPHPTRARRERTRASQRIQSLLREAKRSSARKSPEETERLLIQALTADPQSLPAKVQLASLYLTTSRESKAEALYRDVLIQCGESSVYANLGLACYRQGKYAEAVEAYREAAQRNPHAPQLSEGLVRSLIATHRFGEAIPILERLVGRDARNSELLTMLASCHEQVRDRRSAQKIWQRLSDLQPYDGEAKKKVTEYSLTA